MKRLVTKEEIHQLFLAREAGGLIPSGEALFQRIINGDLWIDDIKERDD